MEDTKDKNGSDGQANSQPTTESLPDCQTGYHRDANGNCVKNDDGNDTHPPKPPVP